MRKYILGALIIVATGCTLQALVGVTVRDQGNGKIEVFNNLPTALVQSTLVITGDNNFSSPNCSREEGNIWSCKLGIIAKNSKKELLYSGTVVSGNLFSYDETNQFYATLLIK